MSMFKQAMALLPKGFYAHNLTRFVNGTIQTKRNGNVKLPIEISIEALGSPFDDLRAVASPEDNKLVPVLLFVDPEEVLKHQSANSKL